MNCCCCCKSKTANQSTSLIMIHSFNLLISLPKEKKKPNEFLSQRMKKRSVKEALPYLSLLRLLLKCWKLRYGKQHLQERSVCPITNDEDAKNYTWNPKRTKRMNDSNESIESINRVRVP